MPPMNSLSKSDINLTLTQANRRNRSSKDIFTNSTEMISNYIHTINSYGEITHSCFAQRFVGVRSTLLTIIPDGTSAKDGQSGRRSDFAGSSVWESCPLRQSSSAPMHHQWV